MIRICNEDDDEKNIFEGIDIEEIKKLMNHAKKDVLINRKDEYGGTMLHSATVFAMLDIANVLLEHRADPNVSNQSGKTPLIQASFKGRTNIVELLLEHGQIQTFPTTLATSL